MPVAVSMITRILLSPLWLLWRFYGILWWAFNDETKSVPPTVAPERSVPNVNDAPPADVNAAGPRTQRAAQDAAFEIIDTRPASAPRPTRALKLGFAFSLIAGVLLAWGFNYAAGHEAIRPSSQLPLWLWSFCMVFVGSLWPVGYIAARQQKARDDGWRAQVLCVAGGMKDCSIATYAGARRAGTMSVAAGRRVAAAATRAGDTAKNVAGRFHRRTA